jgi:glycosyltransferase involved in cell wall biosynthesis
VAFLGKISRNKLGDYYSSADVTCVPSVSEPLATVVLEALVSGCPVVVTDTGGNTFMVQQEQNGLIFPVGDFDALSNALEMLYRKPELLKFLASNSRQSVLKRFMWDKVGNAIHQNLFALPSSV